MKVIGWSEKQRVRFNMVRELYRAIPYNNRPVKQYTSRGSYNELRRDLVLSFKQQYGVGLICTPRGKMLTKNLLLVLDRTELESYWSFNVARSKITGPQMADGVPGI